MCTRTSPGKPSDGHSGKAEPSQVLKSVAPRDGALSLTLGREVHGVSLHGVRRTPLVAVAVSVAAHVAMVSSWEGQRPAIRGAGGEEKGGPGASPGFC